MLGKAIPHIGRKNKAFCDFLSGDGEGTWRIMGRDMARNEGREIGGARDLEVKPRTLYQTWEPAKGYEARRHMV